MVRAAPNRRGPSVGAMTYTTHEFDRYAEVRAALEDPALVPELPGADGGGDGVADGGADGGKTGASVAWLRATVARFSSGEAHRRRRALVAAELGRLEPAALRRAVAAGPEGEIRVRVVRTLAEGMGMAEPGAVAAAVIVVAGAYFGGADAVADEAVAGLVARPAPGLAPGLAPGRADEAGLEAAANRIGLLVQAGPAPAALVEVAAGGDVPLAGVLREAPPVRTMRR